MKTRHWIQAMLIVVLAAVTGCGPKGASGDVEPERAMVFPEPPDTARIQFLARYGSSEDFEKGSGSGFLQTLTGENQTKAWEPIVKPYGATLMNGRLYTCDSMRPGVEVLDFVEGRFEVWAPSGQGAFAKPINCFADPVEGTLYVADVGRSEVLVYDTTGAFLGAFGHGEMVTPVDVFVTEDRVWVADLRGHRVVAFDKATRQPIASLPNVEEGSPNSVFQPTNIWITDDELYVSDFGDFKIKVYTLDGEFVRSVGKYGNGWGMFVRPKGIAVDREGILYVVDAGFQNVQMFNDEGDLLMFFGGPYQGPGTMYLPAKVTIDYDNLHLFQDLVDPGLEAHYLVIVTNQYGPDKVSIYARVEPKSNGEVSGS
jgi:hypothetical protein